MPENEHHSINFDDEVLFDVPPPSISPEMRSQFPQQTESYPANQVIKCNF